MKFKNEKAKRLARKNNPSTSKQSAKKMKTKPMQMQVYDIIKSFKNGCISEQVIKKYTKKKPLYETSSITARYSELERLGLIEFDGVKKASTNRNQRIMRAI